MPEGVGYGSNIVASSGLELNVIGNFAYAYNEISTDLLQAPTNTLEFTTGNFLFVGHWTVSGSVANFGVSDTGGIDQFYLKLNGITVMSLKADTNQEDSPTTYTVPIIIPAYTSVEVLADCTVNNAAWFVSNSLTGKIYK